MYDELIYTSHQRRQTPELGSLHGICDLLYNAHHMLKWRRRGSGY
jgi:hypothetical protein